MKPINNYINENVNLDKEDQQYIKSLAKDFLELVKSVSSDKDTLNVAEGLYAKLISAAIK